MLAPFHSAIDRGEHEKYLFLSLYGNTENLLVAACTPGSISHSKKVKGRLCFVFSVVQHFAGFKQKNSMLNTSAITAVIKVSMKPRSGATANHHLRGSQERNGEQRRTKVSFGRTMILALKLQRLAKRHISGWSNVEQWRNQAHSLSGYQVMLVWRHQIVR